jgi:LPXTG-motif cell wall-anchored protein
VSFHNTQGAVVKRIIIASVMAMTVVAAAAAGTAWGAPSTSGPVITFDDANNVVTLQIPDPPCPASEPGCVWKFFLNEPKVSVDVSTIYGTAAGTLTLAYPQNFCGIIQADAYIGPTANGPWTPQRGWQHQLPDSDCTTPTTSTTSTSTTEVPPTTPTDIPPSKDGSSAAGTVPVTTTSTTPPPVPETKAVSTTPSTTTPTVKADAALTSLPFTGINLMPFVLLGVGCVALGLGLLFGRRKRTT